MGLGDIWRLALDEYMATEHVHHDDRIFHLSFDSASVSISEASDMGLTLWN